MSSPVISPTWGSEEDSWMVLYSLHNYFSMHALVWYHSHASWWQNFYLWDTENIFKESNFFRVFPPLAQSTKPMSSFIFHFYFFFFFSHEYDHSCTVAMPLDIWFYKQDLIIISHSFIMLSNILTASHNFVLFAQIMFHRITTAN
jgi:hypothetical protein